MEKILGESQDLQNYIMCKGISESSNAKALRLATQKQEFACMMSSCEQVQLLCLLLNLIQAERVIEVGVFTGYSTLRMAEVLPESGQIYACDISEERMQIGEQFWKKAGVDHKITPVIAPAMETLGGMLDQGMSGKFDLVYIDADKINQLKYYKLAHQLVRPGGLVLIDNTLWSGQVIDLDDDSSDTEAIRELNTFVSNDASVEHVLLPIGDGVTITMRKHAG